MSRKKHSDKPATFWSRYGPAIVVGLIIGVGLLSSSPWWFRAIFLANRPAMCVSADGLLFGFASDAKTVQVWNCGRRTLTYTVIAEADWILMGPTGGESTGERDEIGIAVDWESIPPGAQSADVVIEPSHGESYIIAIHAEASPKLCFSPTTIEMSATDTTAILEVWNCGGASVDYSISSSAAWLSVSPASGSCRDEHDSITVVVDSQSIPSGQTQATLTITPADGVPSHIQVLAEPFPSFCGPPDEIEFAASELSRTVTVGNCGGGILEYEVHPAAEWMVVTPSAGSLASGETADLRIDVDRHQLTAQQERQVLRVEHLSGGQDLLLPIVIETERTPAFVLGAGAAAMQVGSDYTWGYCGTLGARGRVFEAYGILSQVDTVGGDVLGFTASFGLRTPGIVHLFAGGGIGGIRIDEPAYYGIRHITEFTLSGSVGLRITGSRGVGLSGCARWQYLTSSETAIFQVIGAVQLSF